MPNNIKAGAPNAIVAKSTIDFVSAGITALNTSIIYLVDDPLKSYVPGRAINGITGFEAEKGYYLVAITAMDLSAYVVPPTGAVIPQLATPGNFSVSAGDTENVLNWDDVANATSYTVDRATNVGFTTGVSLGIYVGATSGYTDTGRANGVTYYYRVKATAAGYTDSAYATGNGTPAAAGYDSDAQAFFTAAGITDNTQKDAIDDLVIAMKAASIWTKMNAVYPFVGGTADTHKYNLKNPLDTNGANRLSFVGGVTHNANGVTFDGVDGYADTFFNPSATNVDNLSMGLYSRTTTVLSTGTPVDMGSQQYPNYCVLTLNTNDNNETRLYNYDNGVAGISGTVPDKLWVASLENANLRKLYKNGVELASGTGASGGTPPNHTILIGAVKNSGTPSSFAARNYAFAFIGEGLTSAEVTALTTAVNAFETALSRNV